MNKLKSAFFGALRYLTKIFVRAEDKKEVWLLTGHAYGYTFNEPMNFVGIETTSVSLDIVQRHLALVSEEERNDPEYVKEVSEMKSAVFETLNGTRVELSPRYVGGRLGRNEDTKGNTICSFLYGGQYIALALYNEENREVVVCEY